MHLKYSSWSLYRALRMPLLFVALTLITSSCSPLDIAKTVLGSGPNVNAQVGAENVQGVKVETAAPTVTVRPKARVDSIDQRTVTNQELPGWVYVVFIFLFIVGWITDTPGTMLKRKN